MDKKTSEVLEKSIQKWQDIVDGKGVDGGVLDCALCQKFRLNRFLDQTIYGFRSKENCLGCPVFLKTGLRDCKGTPYTEWYRCGGFSLSVEEIQNDPKMLDLAAKELEFLKSLLPSDELETKNVH